MNDEWEDPNPPDSIRRFMITPDMVSANTDTSLRSIELADTLLLLVALAQSDHISPVKIAIQTLVQQLNEFSSDALLETGVVYCSGDPAAFATVQGRHYESAHRAALFEAGRFVDAFWRMIDPIGYARRQQLELEDLLRRHNSGDFTGAEAHPTQSAIGVFDVSLIQSDWPRARVVIAELLPAEWERDFRAVPIRIRREAMTAHGKPVKTESETPFLPTPMQTSILQALNGRALTKEQLAVMVCDGDSSRLYKPKGRVRNLQELQDLGLVANKPGVGYYRPNAPPPTAIMLSQGVHPTSPQTDT